MSVWVYLAIFGEKVHNAKSPGFNKEKFQISKFLSLGGWQVCVVFE